MEIKFEVLEAKDKNKKDGYVISYDQNRIFFDSELEAKEYMKNIINNSKFYYYI